MPFTPFHMGPGIVIKALLRGSFSLMVFGWTQILMDIQPLIVLITGEGHLHGFSHTYIGATLIAIAAALSGKYLAELGLQILGIATAENMPVRIGWLVAFTSAFVGSFSHVLLDSTLYHDVQPFFPFTKDNLFLEWITMERLYSLCVYSGLVGAALFSIINWRLYRWTFLHRDK